MSKISRRSPVAAMDAHWAWRVGGFPDVCHSVKELVADFGCRYSAFVYHIKGWYDVAPASQIELRINIRNRNEVKASQERPYFAASLVIGDLGYGHYA